jgi:hypothetical protein
MSEDPKTVDSSIVKAPEAGGLANWSDELAKYAKEAAAQAPTGGSYMTFKGGLFVNKVQVNGRRAIPGQADIVLPNQADCIILDSISVNEYYEGEWDPDSPESPSCYAFGRTEEGMKPHEKVKAPKHQDCSGCPFNQWGSDKKGGKGKACKNVTRLALIAASADPGAEEMTFAKMSVSQRKPWGAYVKSLAGQHRVPPFGVVTTIVWTPDQKSQYLLKFLMKELVPTAGLDVIMGRVREARESIAFPFTEFVKAAEPAEGEAPAETPTKARKF